VAVVTRSVPVVGPVEVQVIVKLTSAVWPAATVTPCSASLTEQLPATPESTTVRDPGGTLPTVWLPFTPIDWLEPPSMANW
jgi:hypothetical protein